jgi:phosphoribosylformimino-5-aminoimidazole carboxamide ribotide isomerase
MSAFTIYPAIDIRDGRVVRLRQGDFEQEIPYADEPLALAERYAAAGASWLHLVDLDAARAGGYTLLPLLQRIRANTPLRIQTGGGVRARSDVDAILAAGAERVIVGSLAVREPARVTGWLHGLGPERLVLALDTRQDAIGRWRLPVHGWTSTDGDAELDTLAQRYADAGVQHLMCTDIDRDGTLTGPNLELYRELAARLPGVQLQASGGARDGDDVRAAADAGCAGIVLGRALLEGKLQLGDVLDGEHA